MNERTDENLPLVTIVLAVRNEQRHITQALDTILAQDYPTDRLEILVVDGASEDDSRERILEYARQHPQVRLIDNPQRIAPCAFNLGIANARGSLIQILGAHTVYDANYIRACARPLIDGVAEVSGGLVVSEVGDDSVPARMNQLFLTHPFGVGNNEIRVAAEESRYVPSAAYPMFKREVFERVGLFDERFVRNQDNELNSRVIRAGLRIWLTAETRARYKAQRRFRQLMKLTYGNGLYHVATVRVNPGSFRARYFVPFAFVMALLCSTVLGLFHWVGWLLLALALGAYAVAVVAATVHLAKRRGWRWYLAGMPLLFFAGHLCYGVGTLVGLFKFGLSSRWLQRPACSVPGLSSVWASSSSTTCRTM
ncbi:MAG: glycosyltransferase family 2 protein [Phycisphaerae bacterium]